MPEKTNPVQEPKALTAREARVLLEQIRIANKELLKARLWALLFSGVALLGLATGTAAVTHLVLRERACLAIGGIPALLPRHAGVTRVTPAPRREPRAESRSRSRSRPLAQPRTTIVEKERAR